MVGLAGNIAQFVSFASTLIPKSIEVHGSTGCTSEVLNLDTVYGELSELSFGLQSCSEHGLTVPSQLARHVTAIKELSLSCKTDCDKLLEIPDKQVR